MAEFLFAEDPKLREFLQVMQPRSKAAIWANEDATLASAGAKGAANQFNVPSTSAAKGVQYDDDSSEEDELYEEAPVTTGRAVMGVRGFG